MKKTRNTFVMALLVLTSSINAFAFDIHQKDRNTFVAVQRVGENVRFFKCVAGKDNSCSKIGDKDWYPVDKLNDQCKHQTHSIYYSSVADVVILGGLFLTGSAVLGMGCILPELSDAGMYTAGAVTGVGGTAVITQVSRTLNPVRHYGEAKSISPEVLSDQDVVVTNIDQTIEDLTAVLKLVE